MAKIRLEVNKLENATADYISLVHRASTRIPFRITKAHPHDKEHPMIDIGGKMDLSDLRTVLKSDGKPAEAAAIATKPVLVGIVIEKGDHITEDVTKELTAAGIDVTHPVENDDNTVTFVQGDKPLPEDVTVMKMSDHTLALFTNLDGEQIVKGTPFEPLYEEVEFLLSPNEVAAGLQTTLKQANEDETLTPAQRTQQVAENTTAASAYVQSIEALVPEVATKADVIVCKACVKRKKNDGQAQLDGAAKKAEGGEGADAAAAAPEMVDCPACDGAQCNVCDTGKVTKAEAEVIQKAFPFKKKKAVPAAAAAEGDDKMPPKGAPCAKADTHQEGAPAATMQGMDAAALTAAITTALAPVVESVTKLATDVTALKQAQDKQATDIAGVQTAVSKAEGVLKGTLIGGAAQDDRAAQRVEKAEGELGNLDTAYVPGARRVQKGYGARMTELQRITRR